MVSSMASEKSSKRFHVSRGIDLLWCSCNQQNMLHMFALESTQVSVTSCIHVIITHLKKLAPEI